jgi:hypothetical protein
VGTVQVIRINPVDSSSISIGRFDDYPRCLASSFESERVERLEGSRSLRAHYLIRSDLLSCCTPLHLSDTKQKKRVLTFSLSLSLSLPSATIASFVAATDLTNRRVDYRCRRLFLWLDHTCSPIDLTRLFNRSIVFSLSSSLLVVGRIFGITIIIIGR